MELVLGGVVLLITVLALCNPRLRRDLKSGYSSMDNVPKEGHENLTAALRSKSR